jgi:hypothetical protein
MAQRIVAGEQYEAFLIGGDIEGRSITVDGNAYRSIATITRPSNATAYTAGDVVGDTGGSAIISLTAAGPSGWLRAGAERLAGVQRQHGA